MPPPPPLDEDENEVVEVVCGFVVEVTEVDAVVDVDEMDESVNTSIPLVVAANISPYPE